MLTPHVLTSEELARRRPVWAALSDLWLDTELLESDFMQVATVLKQSGYSLAELRAIHLDEVAPIVSSNLLSVAGVWSGFDEEWLCDSILRSTQQSRPTRARFVRFATEHHWQRLERMLVE